MGHDATAGGRAIAEDGAGAGGPLDFGLLFFAAVGDQADRTYRMLLDSARAADELGFAFVSTPERHFHRFGGAFPNPAVTSAALAAVTRRVQIRAGSVVTPLHHPARVVEDFAMVDGISGGRAAISVGSGWNINDFVLAKDAYETRRERVVEDIAAIRRAWREHVWNGENPHGRQVSVDLFPRPLQPDLPMWITASRSPATFEQAGRLGVGVLTHLENQDLGTLADNIAAYRESFAANGVGEPKVTVMMHTFVAATGDEARAIAAPWLKQYLGTALDLETRAVTAGGSMSGGRPGSAKMSDARAQARIAELGVNRYLDGAALIGSVAECVATARRVRDAGADEIACLIDFVDDHDQVLAALKYLNAVREQFAG